MIAVVWIDWYSYHVARFRALSAHRAMRGSVAGIELVGGCGVHAGMKFRDERRDGLAISTLLPGADWSGSGRFHVARLLWKKLTEAQPKTVLVPGYYTIPGIAAAVWARLHRRRSILMTETTEFDHRRTRVKETLKRWLLRTLFDAAVCGGKPHARYLRALGFPSENIAGCYDVVDNGFFASAAQAVREQRNVAPHFLYVGRLASEKNVDGLIDAFGEYRRRGGTWPLVVAGDGPERECLVKRCERLGIARFVDFKGFQRTRETADLYAGAGCFVLPSKREPWGLVVNEAMAAGVPVVVSNRCGCAEDLVRNGENGFVFDPANRIELADRLLQISALAPDELRRMGARSSEIIQDYSLERWADEVARIANPR